MSSVGYGKVGAVLGVLLCLCGLGRTQQFVTESLNRPERPERFRDQGFGIFIHWSVDSQIGTVISHSLVDASPEYASSFYRELPKTFFPERYDADAMARLVKISGARYLEAWNRQRVVLQLSDLLFEGHATQQVVHARLHG